MSGDHLTMNLAEFIDTFDAGAAPEQVVDRTVQLLTDAIACGIGARQLAWGQALHRSARALDSTSTTAAAGPALLGGTRAALVPAVAMNALLINCLDYDDTHFGHPGAVVVPVALAVGHLMNSSYRQLVEAVMVGYEVAGRVAAAANPSRSGRDGIWGTGLRFAPSAAAVAGKVLGLGRDQLAHALALAACDGPVPSVRQTVYGPVGPSMAKNNYHASATAGLTAAYLAREGFVGPLDVFDSELGFAALTGTDRWQPEELTSDAVHTLRVDSKPYSCCRKIHGSLDGVRALQNEHGFSHEDVLGVTLTSPAWSSGGCFSNYEPQRAVEVQFSAVFCSAMVLHRVRTGTEWFNPGWLRNEAVRATAHRVRLVESDTAESKGHPFWTHVAVRTTSGVYERAVGSPRGSVESRLADHELHAKFTKLVSPVIGTDAATDLHAILAGGGTGGARRINALIGAPANDSA